MQAVLERDEQECRARRTGGAWPLSGLIKRQVHGSVTTRMCSLANKLTTRGTIADEILVKHVAVAINQDGRKCPSLPLALLFTPTFLLAHRNRVGFDLFATDAQQLGLGSQSDQLVLRLHVRRLPDRHLALQIRGRRLSGVNER